MRSTLKNAGRVFLAAAVLFAIKGLDSPAHASLTLTTLGTAVPQNFDALGTSGLNLAALNGADGWRIVAGMTPTFAAGTSTLGVAQTTILNSSSAGNSYSFRPTASGSNASDRAVGFLNSGSFTSPQSLMVQISNNTGQTITELDLSFDYEKYRTGTRAFTENFFQSSNGSTWTAATAGDQSYAADGANAGQEPTTISKSLSLTGLSIATGSSYFLRWTLTGTGGSTNGQGIGIDNFSIKGTVAVPEARAFVLGGMIFVVMGSAYGIRWRRRFEGEPTGGLVA